MTIIDSSSSPQPSDHVHTFHLRKREMSSSAKDDSRSSFDKLRSNFMRTSKSDEVKNVNTVKSVESQSSPTRCPAESSGLSNYQPLENLSKLVDSAPSMKEVTKFRSEGLSKWNSTHCDLEGAKISKSCKPSPSRSTPTSEHKTSLETTKESHDEKRQKKRKVFSIADILDPHFGSKSSNDSKRTRFDHPEPTRTPYLQNSLPVPFPVMNPIVCGMLEQHTGAYFWNFCQTNSSPNHLYPKLEKENPSMCNNNNNGFNNYLPIPLHQNLFYHHPSMTSYHLPYAMSLRRVKPPTPPLETFSSSGDTRSQQESLKLILANKDKGSTFSGSADTGEYHNNHRALPSSSPPPPPPPLPTTTSRPHNKSGDRTPGITTESPRSTTSQPLDKTSEQNRSQMSQKLWPAWVYCTRYSDRPSSGPRTRKPRRKMQKSSADASIQQTSSSSSSSSAVDDKRPRTAFNQEQLAILKKEFAANQYLTEERRISLSSTLGLNESQIKIWFQNKRAKLKKSSGIPNRLAIELMAQGLYNHSTLKSSQQKSGATSPSSSSSRSPAAF